MRSPDRRTITASILAAALLTGSARGQSALDRPVGVDFFGRPLVIEKLTTSDIGALAAAAHVPMGFEGAPDGPRAVNVEASGKTLRAVLDAIVAADPRYEWREDAGVALLRPTLAWTDSNSPLYRNVGAIRFDDVGVSDALQIVVSMFGQDLHPSQRTNLGETRRFTLDAPPGTVFDALNAIVRAHGALAWGVEPYPPPTAIAPGTVLSPFMASLVSGGSGRAIGIGVHLDREPKVPEEIERWGRPQPASNTPLLARVVGTKSNGEPLIVHSAYDVPELAAATRAAMGVELLPPAERRSDSQGVNVTGLSLRDALAVLVTLDPRYDWRELEGVVVVRPLLAWTEPAHPLSRDAGPTHLQRATVGDAVNYLQTLVEPGMKYTQERDRGVDVARISIAVDRTQLLLVLNTIVKSFGDVCWIYDELNARETKFFGGRNHQINLRSPTGDGQGFAFR